MLYVYVHAYAYIYICVVVEANVTYEGRLINNTHSEISRKETMYLNKRK